MGQSAVRCKGPATAGCDLKGPIRGDGGGEEDSGKGSCELHFDS